MRAERALSVTPYHYYLEQFGGGELTEGERREHVPRQASLRARILKVQYNPAGGGLKRGS